MSLNDSVALTSDGVIAHPQSKYGYRFSIICTTEAARQNCSIGLCALQQAYFAKIREFLLKSHGAQQFQQADYVGRREVTLRLRARQQQVHQFVVAQLQQAGQSGHVGVTEVMLISAEEAIEDQIVFQQAAPRAPAKARPAKGIGLMRVVLIVDHHIVHLRQRGAPSIP
ncbi:protein of unknown function (plasmid) [Caballeronia sp. S22]